MSRLAARALSTLTAAAILLAALVTLAAVVPVGRDLLWPLGGNANAFR